MIILELFFRYAKQEDDYPDLQLFLASVADNTDGGFFGKRGTGLKDESFANVFEEILYKDAYSILPVLLRPKSRGFVKLRSSDPEDHPIIVPNYFSDPQDLDILVHAIFILLNSQNLPQYDLYMP